MGKNNATSLTKLRQPIRRYNKDFEKAINDFKVNPGSYPKVALTVEVVVVEDMIAVGDEENTDITEEEHKKCVQNIINGNVKLIKII